MIRTFQVKLNGKEYSAEIEETTQSPAVLAAASMPMPKVNYQVPERAAAPVQQAAPAGAGGGATVVASPLPASVFKMKVAKGGLVKKGDVVVILEAMKMENEVFAPSDGTVMEIKVKEGDSVNTGDALLIIG